MKAMYIIPETGIETIQATSLLNSVSGLGFVDKGADDGTHGAQAPDRKVF